MEFGFIVAERWKIESSILTLYRKRKKVYSGHFNDLLQYNNKPKFKTMDQHSEGEELALATEGSILSEEEVREMVQPKRSRLPKPRGGPS